MAGPFNNATRLEGSIHKRLDEFRKFGEWFLCDEKIVILAAQELSLEFVDKPDVSEEDSARIQAQFIKELLTDPVDRVISSFDASLEKLMSSYQESVSLNESLSAQYQEACELLDWYGTELKDVLFMAKKAMDQVKRLELQVQKLKEKNSEEEIA